MYRIRDCRTDDIPFILDSWARSFENAKAVSGMERNDYYPAMFAKIKSILARDHSLVKVACAEADEDTILGWSCFEHNCLHYVFVKKDVRNLGIAKDLIPDYIELYSFKSPRIEKVPNGWKYRPDLMW